MALFLPSVEFLRANDTTAYGSNSVVSNSKSSPTWYPLELPGSAGSSSTRVPRGIKGSIVQVYHECSTVLAGNARFSLHFYAEQPSQTPPDGETFIWRHTDRSRRIGYVDLTGYRSGAGASDGCACFSSADLYFDLVNDYRIFPTLVAVQGYTPVAQERHYIRIAVVADDPR